MAGHDEAAEHSTELAEQGGRHERPEDWGWHGEFGRWARVAGWLSVVALILINVTTRYNNAEAPWLYGIAGLMVVMLLRDWYRRRNAWRE